MALIKFEPMRGYEGLTRRMNSLVNAFDSGFNIQQSAFLPKVDITEDNSKLYINAEMSGLTKDDFKITVSDENILCIKGSKKNEHKEENKEQNRSYIRIERTYGSFERNFLLPDYVNRDSITAKYENGVLNISFDKAEPQKPKEIEIKVN